MYATVIFLGINNCSAVIQYVTTQQTAMYREHFAGMYSSWAYSLAQVQYSLEQTEFIVDLKGMYE